MSRDLLKWLLANGIFLAVLYTGLSTGLNWLATAASAFVWIMLVAYISAYISKEGKQRHDPAPRWLGLAVDVFVLYGWFSNGWYLTGLAYLTSIIILTLLYRRSEGIAVPAKAASTEGADLGREMQIAVEAGKCMAEFLQAPSKQLGFSYARVPQDFRADYLLGFISSATDVVAQSLGGQSGGNASINGTLRALTAAFGENRFEPYFHRTVQLHDNPTKDFTDGFERGNRWANALLQQRSDEATLLVMETFGVRYSECIQ